MKTFGTTSTGTDFVGTIGGGSDCKGVILCGCFGTIMTGDYLGTMQTGDGYA